MVPPCGPSKIQLVKVNRKFPSCLYPASPPTAHFTLIGRLTSVRSNRIFPLWPRLSNQVISRLLNLLFPRCKTIAPAIRTVVRAVRLKPIPSVPSPARCNRVICRAPKLPLAPCNTPTVNRRRTHVAIPPTAHLDRPRPVHPPTRFRHFLRR